MKFIEIVTTNMKARRKELKLTQEQVAKKIGMLRQNYVKIELGKHNFGISTLSKISEALEIDICELMEKKL